MGIKKPDFEMGTFISLDRAIDLYKGKTDSKKSRFGNGHLAALKLHNPKYNKYNKRIYFGIIMFLSKKGE